MTNSPISLKRLQKVMKLRAIYGHFEQENTCEIKITGHN